jgi:predicted N-acetyltransferase YhbS
MNLKKIINKIFLSLLIIIIMSKSNPLIIKDIVGGFKEPTKYFSYTIYKNFEYLSNAPIMHHNLEEIDKLLKSENMYCFLVYDTKNIIIGYLIGEIIKLSDNRMVFFINYLYVFSKYRKMGIGSKLINLVKSKIEKWKINGIMTLCDTSIDAIVDFYAKKNFIIDPVYKRNDRYEILSWFKNKK